MSSSYLVSSIFSAVTHSAPRPSGASLHSWERRQAGGLPSWAHTQACPLRRGAEGTARTGIPWLALESRGCLSHLFLGIRAAPLDGAPDAVWPKPGGGPAGASRPLFSTPSPDPGKRAPRRRAPSSCGGPCCPGGQDLARPPRRTDPRTVPRRAGGSVRLVLLLIPVAGAAAFLLSLQWPGL